MPFENDIEIRTGDADGKVPSLQLNSQLSTLNSQFSILNCHLSPVTCHLSFVQRDFDGLPDIADPEKLKALGGA